MGKQRSAPDFSQKILLGLLWLILYTVIKLWGLHCMQFLNISEKGPGRIISVNTSVILSCLLNTSAIITRFPPHFSTGLITLILLHRHKTQSGFSSCCETSRSMCLPDQNTTLASYLCAIGHTQLRGCKEIELEMSCITLWRLIYPAESLAIRVPTGWQEGKSRVFCYLWPWYYVLLSQTMI